MMDIHTNLRTGVPSPPLPALRLRVAPLQLLTAAMWRVAEEGNVGDYGTLEEIVMSVTEAVPEVLDIRRRAQLIIGLRAKMVLELCRAGTAELQVIQPHLDRIRAATLPLEGPGSCVAEVAVATYHFHALVHNLLGDPAAKEHFFQEVFPVDYGPEYDSILQGLIWDFLSGLEQLLPPPDLKQTASWLSTAPSILDECVESLCHSGHLKALLHIHRNKDYLNSHETASTSSGDCIFSSLWGLLGVATRRTETEIQSEFLTDPAMYEEDVGAERVVVMEYAEVELGPSECVAEERKIVMENRLETQKVADADPRGIHLGREFVFMCEEVEQIHADIGEYVSEESCLMNNAVGEVVSDEIGPAAATSCEALESRKGEKRIVYEKSKVTDDVNDECQKSGISVDNIEYLQAGFKEDIHEERKFKEGGAERDQTVQAPHTDTDEGEVFCQLGWPGILLHRNDNCDLTYSTSSSTQPLNQKKTLQRSKGRSQESIEGRVVVLRNEVNVPWVVSEKMLQEAPQKGEDTECCSAGPINSAVPLTKGERTEAAPLDFDCYQCSSCHTDETDIQQHTENHVVEDDRRQDSGDNGLEPGPEPTSSPHPKQSSLQPPHKPRKYSKRKFCSKTCPVCGKTFSRATDMRRHQRSHTGERPYKCSQCGKSFLYSFDLKRHQRKGDGSSQFQCCVCGEGFDRENGLVAHHNVAHPADAATAADPDSRMLVTADDNVQIGEESCGNECQQHKCHQCDVTFSQRTEMKRHQMIHTEDDPLRCNQCCKKCPNLDALSRHMQLHDVGQHFQCATCKINFPQFICLRQHYLMKHNTEGSFLCSDCPKSFSRLSNLIKHQRTHTGERPYQCSHCSKRFTQLQILTRHERIHTGERPFLCSDCGKSFLSSGELTKHLQSHSEERPFPCLQCGKTFKANRFLKKHLQTHSGERPFPCSHCGKRFAKSADLTRHNRTHTGERPHSCSQCGKSFLSYTEVLKHERYHTGERPFKCAQCGKTFTQSCYLTVHMRIHTGERPYHCTVCGKSFNSTTPLRRHMLTHTGEKPFKCSDCGKAYNRLHLLRSHERIHAVS